LISVLVVLRVVLRDGPEQEAVVVRVALVSFVGGDVDVIVEVAVDTLSRLLAVEAKPVLGA
jgi:hypothetical protein